MTAFGSNETPVTFRDRTVELQLSMENSAVCWSDFNNDGWVDLCAGSAWLNEAGRKFTKLQDGIGCAVAADFDNDGFVDLFSWSALCLYKNDAGRGFTAVALPASPKCVSRGACWGDFNGDGFVDLYIGGYEDWDADITYPDMLLSNERGVGFRLTWSEVRYRARGVTACDFDRDGDLDLVTAGRLFENLSRGNHWLEIRLRGGGSLVNRCAIGSQVRVKLEEKSLTRQVEAGTGEGNQNDLVLHFGLGARTAPIDLEIFWSNGQVQRVGAVNVDQLVEYRISLAP